MSFSIDTTSFTSPNFDRHADGSPVLITPLGILIHSSEGDQSSDIPWLCNPHTGDPRIGTEHDPRVSCNYYINREGYIYQLVPDTQRAWHAGPSLYAGLHDWNRAIGVELTHRRGDGDYPDPQLDALMWLCRSKIAQWHIPQSRIAAHRWVALPPGRKADPTDWSDTALRMWIASLYEMSPGGTVYRVRYDDCRVRTGPGTTFPVATFGPSGPKVLLPRDFTFVSDGLKDGESVGTNRTWVHVAQPAAWGWISATLVERV